MSRYMISLVENPCWLIPFPWPGQSRVGVAVFLFLKPFHHHISWVLVPLPLLSLYKTMEMHPISISFLLPPPRALCSQSLPNQPDLNSRQDITFMSLAAMITPHNYSTWRYATLSEVNTPTPYSITSKGFRIPKLHEKFETIFTQNNTHTPTPLLPISEATHLACDIS